MSIKNEIKSLICKDSRCQRELNFIKESDLHVVIYGAGDYSYDDIYGYLKDNDIKTHCHVVDLNYKQECSPKVKNKILTWEELMQSPEKVIVVIGMSSVLMKNYENRLFYEKVLMDKYGNNIEKILWFDVVFYRYFSKFNEYVNRNIKYFDAVYSLLQDDLSRKAFVGFINSKLAKKPDYNCISQGMQYFPNDIISISNHEIFVDCGAYTGDTFTEFLKISKGEYSKYYGWEPDSKNFAVLKKLADQHPRLIPINYGVYSSYQKMNFSESHGRTDSVLQTNGDMSIEVNSIDNICTDATFIKMDIEGAELEALEGADSTIQNNAPTLAISIYHRPEHLYKIPLLINKINPKYKLFVRHHSTISNELVLYAVC